MKKECRHARHNHFSRGQSVNKTNSLRIGKGKLASSQYGMHGTFLHKDIFNFLTDEEISRADTWGAD
jgi:hypothetical protein